MAASTTVKEHEFHASTWALPRKRFSATVSLGNPYASGGIAYGATQIQAALRTALGRTDVNVTTVHSLEIVGSSDPSYSYEYDAGNGKILCYIKPAASLNAGALPSMTVTSSASLSLDAGKLSEALPAGTVCVLGGRSSGGTAGVIKLVPDAPANTLEAQYIPASRKVQLLAGDANTGLVVQYLSLAAGTLPTINSTGVAAEAGAVDLSGYTCEIVAIVS